MEQTFYIFDVAPLLIILAVFIVAVLYSSVGHGGASGYLAVMALLAVAPEITRPTAARAQCVRRGDRDDTVLSCRIFFLACILAVRDHLHPVRFHRWNDGVTDDLV